MAAASFLPGRRGLLPMLLVLVLFLGPALGSPLLLPVPAPLPGTEAPLPVEALPGLSELDVSFALARLARGDASALEAFAPFRAGAQALDVPGDLLAPVRDPPPLRATLLALARDHPEARQEMEAQRLLRSVSLPADVERALSSLGQAALGATALARAGLSLDAAALLQIGLEGARPSLERHAILLGHAAAYTAPSWDEPGTRRRLAGMVGAQAEHDALGALGFDADAPPVHPLPLSSELAELYARLGLPLGFEERAALAAADGLDARLRLPLAEALARVREATRLRDDAYAELSPDERDLLSRTEDIARAVATPRPTEADLQLLSAYGAAVDALDRDAIMRGAAHLLAATRGLVSLRSLEGCCDAPSVPLAAGFSMGGLVVTWTVDGDVRVRVAEDDDAPERAFSVSNASFDEERFVVTVTGDGDGDGEADDTLLRTPPLRWPARDVLFMDPYGLVLVTGTGSTQVDAVFSGHAIELTAEAVPPAPDAMTPVLGALAAFDDLLRPDPTGGVWPWARDEARASLEGLGGDPIPRHLVAQVNPWAYQVLHVDLGGDDHYMTNAAGAGDRGLVALWADGAGGALHPRVAYGPVPAALLVDLGGSDVYETRGAHTLGAANQSLALLADPLGDDLFQANATAHALASATGGGLALLLGGAGNSTYAARNESLAHATGAATALLLDPAGRDRYHGGNGSLAVSDLGMHALLFDLEGNDTYRSANFSQGASRGGLALLLEAGGRDQYAATPTMWSQGYAEPARASSLPCPTGGAPCVGEPGPARIALLVDAGGLDKDVCREGRISNAAVGSVGFGREPVAAGPFNPTYGACLDADANPGMGGVGAAPGQPLVDLPPTFFTSSFGNFTLPGLARLGSLGADLVREPYVLSVDLLGDDAYGVGAIATLNATRAGWEVDLGYVSPVSLSLDLDGRDLFDTNLARGRAPGAFAWADGGVAVQAKIAARRVDDARYAPGLWNATRDPANATSEEIVETDVGDNRVNESDRSAPPLHLARYRNVSRGLASATNGGVALLLSDGVAADVSAAPDASPGGSCRLACARNGGAAFLLSDGGAGDRIVASPFSMGAVDERPLGGVAVYARRGGPDVFEGSNESMGVAAPFPTTQAVPDPAEGRGSAPSVALFLKDGFAQDAYAETMRSPGLARLPRDNEHVWEDRATFDVFHAFGARSLHVARGVDNLDWYLHMNLAAADRGVSPDQGPGSPFHPGGPAGEASRRWATLPPNVQDAVGRSPAGPPLGTILNATADDATTYLPARVPGADHGDGGSNTGPYGVKPVTLARTAFSPILNLTAVKTVGPYQPPHRKPFLGDVILFRATIKNPPAFADQTYGKPISGTQANPDGDAIARVELVVKGTSPRWRGCPIPEKADLVEPGACVVASWDRRVHHLHGNEQVRRHLANDTQPQMTEWEIQWNANGAVSANDSTPAFPPGPYVITLRAYADRPDGVPVLTPYGVRDQVLEATVSDALNHTDDSYGLFGSAYHLSVPVYNVPSVNAPTTRVRDSNGVAPATFTVEITSPVRYWVNVTNSKNAVVSRLGPYETPYFEDEVAYAADGNDYLNFTWAPGNNPTGRYRATIEFVSKLSQTKGPTLQQTLYVDPDAPTGNHDPRGVPGGVVTRADAPDGRFPVPIERDPTASTTGSLTAGVHLWVQEDVLDAADPTIVLERHPWTYHRFATDLGTPSESLQKKVPEALWKTWTAPMLHGDPFPGPPRVYRVAAYVEDRAGNVVPEDPIGTPPPGPDCIAGVCASYLYDITPPRTRLLLEGPEAATGRMGNATLALRVDASETPDAQAFRTYAALVPAEHAAAFETARLGVDAAPPPAVKGANVSLLAKWDRPLFLAPEGLVTPGAKLNVTLILQSLDKSSLVDGYEANEFNASRPLWVRIDFVDAAGAPTGGPYLYNATHMAKQPLQPGLNVTLWPENVVAPSTSGVHRMRVAIDQNRSAPNLATGAMPLAAELHAPFVVWSRLPSPVDGLLDWTPPAAFLVDGAAVHLLSRGVDRVGNVEEKTEHDLRLVVDLSPPRLTRVPTVVAGGFSATFLWETDEPCACAVQVLDVNGTAVSTVATPVDALEHEATVDDLLPERPYGYRILARDALGNLANLSSFNGTPFAFRTGPALRLNLTAPPTLAAQPFNATWSATDADALNLTYHLRLSLDGGRTYPVNLTGAGLRAYETGGRPRVLTVDPARHPESANARLRLDAVPDANPDVTTSVLSLVFTLDGRGPALRFDAPAGGRGVSSYARGPIQIRANATDAGAGVASVEVSRDNLTFEPVSGNLTVAGDDPVLLWFRAADKAGHVTTPAPLKVLLDGRAPQMQARPDVAAPTARASALVSVRGADDGSGLARIVATENATRWSLTLDASALAEGRASFAWPLAGDPDGARRLTVTVEDRAGNVARENVTVTVDRRAPRPDARLVEATMSGALLRVELDEPAHVAAHVPGRAPVESPSLQRAHELRVEGLRPGASHLAMVRAFDEAGNEAVVHVVFDTLRDAQRPSTVQGLRAESLPGGEILLSWDPATDDDVVEAYRVLRADVDAREWAALGETAAATFVDATGVPGSSYAWRVVAMDRAGNLAFPSDDRIERVRTAPRVSNVSVEPMAMPDGAPGLHVRATVVDPDGDVPTGEARAGDRVATLETIPHGNGTWTVDARLPAPAGRLLQDRTLHLVVRDGLFEARHPEAGGIRLPLTSEESSAPPGFLLGAARSVPTPAVAVSLAALLATALAIALYLRRRPSR